MARKRGRGEGSTSQRAHGSWAVSLQVSAVRRHATARTRPEAVRRLTEFKVQPRRGSLPKSGHRTVADLVHLWMGTAAPSLKPRTVSNCLGTFEHYLLPELRAVKLARLEPAHVRPLVSRVQSEGKPRAAPAVYGGPCIGSAAPP